MVFNIGYNVLAVGVVRITNENIIMEKIEIKRKLVEEALDQLKAAQQDSYVQSTQNVIDELELALRQPPVISRRELLLAFHDSLIGDVMPINKFHSHRNVDSFLASNSL